MWVCVRVRVERKRERNPNKCGFPFECGGAWRPSTHSRSPRLSRILSNKIEFTSNSVHIYFMEMLRCLGVGLQARLCVGVCVSNMQNSFQSTPPTHIQTHTENSKQIKDLNTVTLFSFFFTTSHMPCSIYCTWYCCKKFLRHYQREKLICDPKKEYLVLGESALQTSVKVCI